MTLFERLSHGYVMTAAGEHFFRHGLVLNESIVRIQRELGGQDLRLQGELTVTSTDSLLHRLTPVFMAFQQQYPDVELRLLSDVRPLDLMQRDADIALRPTRHPPEHWIGRSLLSVAYAAYARSDYLKAMQDSPLENHRWIRLDDDLNRSPMSEIMMQRKADDAPITIANSIMGIFDLVRAGLGIAVLPCYLGENSPELSRLLEPDAAFNTDLWILAHPDIRRSARAHAFFEFATAKIRDSGSDFIGTNGSAE